MMARAHGIVIAIDGPSGAGKSTLARLLAERIGYLQIDTGAMYRAAAYLISRAGIDPSDLESVEKFCDGMDIRLLRERGRQTVIANGIDVTGKIRTPEMSLLTSRISALKPVRDALMTAQRRMGSEGGVVLEGRDIGTVVFPDAELKIYLNASAEERGRRRFEELAARGERVTLEETVADVVKRDIQDSVRDLAPLRKADDAVEVDSSMISVDDVLAGIEELYRRRISTTGSVT